MPESKEATKDTTNEHEGGFSAPVAGIEEQKKKDLQRIAGLLDNGSPDFLAAVTCAILRMSERALWITMILDLMDQRMNAEQVGSLLVAWERRLALGPVVLEGREKRDIPQRDKDVEDTRQIRATIDSLCKAFGLEKVVRVWAAREVQEINAMVDIVDTMAEGEGDVPWGYVPIADLMAGGAD